MFTPTHPIKPPSTGSDARQSTATAAPFQGCTGVTGCSKPSKKLSVSQLAFPFNGRRKPAPPGPPSPIPKRAPIEPPARQKHVCLPSPLGRGASDDAPRPATPARLGPRPRYHGYSRHSLMLTKWVWSTRQEQHAARTLSTEERVSSDALPKSPSTSHPSFQRLRRLRSFYTEEKKPEQAPLTMYPRQGDLTGLRDPYCVRVDRCFATIPLHTLRKLVCLFMLLAPRQDAFEEAGSEVSFGSGTESDATLVDSDADSDWDVSTTCSSRQEGGLDDVIGMSSELSKGNLLSLAVRRVHRELGDVSTVHMANPVWLCRLYQKPAFATLPKEQAQRVVQGGWEAAWELLIELSKRDVGLASLPPTKREVVKPKPPKEFRWLKLLGGPKGGAAAGAKKPAPAPVLSPPVSPVVKGPLPYSRSAFLTPSHPAAG